ncbi:alpha-2-macroglobulin [Campylobacter sp. RM12920]|uniref:Alpha-2-macroglobulin n=1 Tax=Campylobacter californiensis TaxID=1032243 RepID=A0ABD4JGP5_9BACT|nr:alpha-2-macroglobulin [Campylobacter sp. RM12919]MBE2988140.1 alpha-2-macroglobulin [Campylobacter sp. RM12920]
MNLSKALLILFTTINLSALTFDQNITQTPFSIEFGVNETIDEKLVGTTSDDKILTCVPEINATIEYKTKSIILYTKDLHAGKKHTCKMQNSKINFSTPNFELKSIDKISDYKFVLKFNDKVSANELKQKLAINDNNFSIQNSFEKAFVIALDKAQSNPAFNLPKDFSSEFNATLGADLNITYSKPLNEENIVVENEKAKTLTIDKLYPQSLNNGKLAARIYLKDWLYNDRNFNKFIEIKGIKNFQITNIGYVIDENKTDEIGEDFYYYFDIVSDEFKALNEYEITIKKGFGDNWNVVRDDSTYIVKMPNLAPFAEFINDKPYISSVGEIGIRSVNVSNLKVVIEKLSDQNYRYFLNFKPQPNDIDEFVSEIASKNYELGGVLNEFSSHKIKLDFTGVTDGIYRVNLYYDKDKHTSKVVYLSDIAVNAKLSKDEIFVFANRLGENIMLANANVKIYSKKNDEITIGATNDEGVFKFSKKDIYKDVGSLVVSLAKEQNFLIINEDGHINKDAAYSLKDGNQTIDAFTHFASNLIRPDESIKGVSYLRDRNFTPISNMPVKVKITDPQNKEIANLTYQTNEVGAFDFNESISSELSGRFTFSVIYAGKILSKEPFYVESFTPTRIKNEITLAKDKFHAQELGKILLSSSYLFGSKASFLNGSLEIDFVDLEYKNEQYKDYKFKDDTVKNLALDGFYKPVKLDENGTSKESFVIDINDSVQTQSIANGIINFNINDDGQNVSASKLITIFPKQNLVGIYANKNFVEPEEKVNFKTVVLDTKSMKEVKSNLKFEIKRRIWNYTTDAFNELRWFESLETIATFTQENSALEYAFAQSGNYTVVVTDIISKASTSIDIDVSGYTYSTLMPTKELSKAQIKLNAKSYKKGDELSADISSVIKEGLALVTVESGNVKAYKLARIKNNSANVKFKLDFDFTGLYVSANIYRLADEGSTPFRTHAKVYANADKSDRNIQLLLNAPKSSFTNKDVKIEIETEPNADIALFLADFGILNITSQPSPNPLQFFDKVVSDGVFDYDFYDRLTGYKLNAKTLNFGGDSAANMLMAAKMAKYESPVDTKNIKTFYEATKLKADENGTAVYMFKTPSDFNSAIRIDVISSSKLKMSSTSAVLEVKDDVVLKPTKLSYMINGDEIEGILRILNTTENKKTLNLSSSHSHNLDINLSQTSVNLQPFENIALNFNIKAKDVADAKFEITATDEANNTFANLNNITIINAQPKSTYAKSFSVHKSRKFKLANGYTDIAIDASSSIYGLLAAMSKNLISYPYGCSEQRSSRLLALLHAKSADETEEKDRVRFINSAIKELSKMQNKNGEFGYWSELGAVDSFASIYTADVLFELSKAGFNVDENIKKQAINGLKHHTNGDNALYAMYVLSKNSKASMSEINQIYDTKNYTKTTLSKYLMASILQAVGYKNEALMVLKNLDVVKTENESIGFSSNLRDKAFILYLHATNFEKNTFSDNLAKELLTKTNSARSTQERAFMLRALNAYFADLKDDKDVKFKVKYDGKVEEFNANQTINLNTKKGEFEVEATGDLFITISSSAYIPLQIKHAKEKKELDIYRTFVTNDGKEISLNSLKLNDIVYSKVEILSKADLVGALNEITSTCFEPINENLANFTRDEAVTNSINLSHQLIKDDRVLSFFELKGGENAIIYTPYRVVLKGKCSLPAVIGENMYNEAQNDYDLATKSFIIK